jgi:hypothetical protein
VYLADSPLGPAGRWFIDRLKEKAALRVTLNSPESADLIEAQSRSRVGTSLSRE